MECSAKKGGDDVSGAEGIFGKVVDKVRRRAAFFLHLALWPSRAFSRRSVADTRFVAR